MSGSGLSGNGVYGGLTSRQVGAMLHPGYVSGTWIGLRGVTVGGGYTYAADTLYAFPLRIFSPVTINLFALNVSLGVASCLGRVGVYSNAAGWPDALLATTADIDLSVTAAITAAPTAAPTLAPGIAWLAFLASGAAQCTGYTNNGNMSEELEDLMGGALGTFITSSAGAGRNTRVVRTAAAPFGSGLPASFGAATRGSGSPAAPIITMRAA